MTDEELKIWIIDKFNSCYIVKHDYDNIIYYVYDDSYIRKLKICKLDNKKRILPKKVNGICLFKQYLDDYTFFVDYTNIWTFFINNYRYNFDRYNDITRFIEDTLKKSNYISDYYFVHVSDLITIDDPINLKIIETIYDN